MTDVPGGAWFVRFAGRRTGPYDLERLRTLARRGALTPLHFLSSDGASWKPATSVRAVFNADGSVVSGPAGFGAAAGDGQDGLVPLFEGEIVGGEPPSEPPRQASMPRARPSASPAVAPVGARAVSVRPVAIAAVVLAAAAILCSALADLPREPAWLQAMDGARSLRLAVRMLQAVAVLGGIVLVAMPHERVRSAAAAAVAGVVASVSAIDACTVPWACAALLAAVPVAPMLALDGSRGGALRSLASFTALAAPLAAVATVWFAFSSGSAPWPGFAAAAAAGCVAIAAGGASALGWMPRGPGRPFALAGGGAAVVALASMFPAALEPGNVALREVAVDACAVLAFAGACWAAALGAHPNVPEDGPDGRPAAGRGAAP